MSVKVTTPTKNSFDSACNKEGKAKLESNKMNLSKKLDSIVNFTIKKSKSTDIQTSSGKNQNNASNHASKKRRYSEKWHSPYGQGNKKKGKYDRQREKIKLPTKFLLGGNISDPLNLNSLLDEDVSKAFNAVTPVASPLPMPSHKRQKVEVLIPPNINDPLNLNSGEDVGILSPVSTNKKRKKHKRKKSESELNVSGETCALEGGSELLSPLNINIDSKTKAFANEIVSPAIPQDSPKHKKRKSIEVKSTEAKAAEGIKSAEKHKYRKQHSNNQLQKPKFGQRDSKFVHGNYNRYYGKRNPDMAEDERLKFFQKDWFEGRDVLDIGCNIGHITLSIAKKFNPKTIVGMDIDASLISVARKNIRHYVSSDIADVTKYPMSLPITYGPLAAPSLDSGKGPAKFPLNVNFVTANYVLENEELIELQSEEYDVVLALSITKWLQLNNGDSGLKRAFKRMFRQLRPGGKLILEPQPRRTYKKKSKLNETIWKNFKEIKLWPENFRSYLLSPEVGFVKCEYLDVPANKSKGFQRPIMVFSKAETRHTTPREVTESRGVTPLMNIDCGGHNFTPYNDPSSTPSYDLHSSFSFSSQYHMPIRGYDAFLENQLARAFTPTQDLISVNARTAPPRFDIGTPSVSTRNTPVRGTQSSETDSNEQWVSSQSSVDPLFDQLGDSTSEANEHTMDSMEGVKLIDASVDSVLQINKIDSTTEIFAKSPEHQSKVLNQEKHLINTCVNKDTEEEPSDHTDCEHEKDPSDHVDGEHEKDSSDNVDGKHEKDSSDHVDGEHEKDSSDNVDGEHEKNSSDFDANNTSEN